MFKNIKSNLYEHIRVSDITYYGGLYSAEQQNIYTWIDVN